MTYLNSKGVDLLTESLRQRCVYEVLNTKNKENYQATSIKWMEYLLSY